MLEVNILKSRKRPHFAKDEDGKWTAYVRVADQNFQANRILIKVWNHTGSEKGTLLKYGKEERALIHYLETNPCITLSKFTKIAYTTRQIAESILVKLITINVIDIQITDKMFFFKLRSDG